MCGKCNPEKNSELEKIKNEAEKLMEKSREFASEVTKKLLKDSYVPPKEMSENQRIKSENEKIINACKEASQADFNMQSSKNKMEMVIQGIADGTMLYSILNEMPDHFETEIIIDDGLSIAEASSIPGVRYIRRETKIYGRMPATDLMKLLLHYDMATVKIENKMIIRWINPNYA